MLSGLAIDAKGTSPQGFDFRFCAGAFRPDEIFESATATPGRYLLEIGRRLHAAAAGAEWLAIGNPLLPLQAAKLAAWLGDRREAAILADDRGFPVLYLLPRRLFDRDERLLLCLSTVDAAKDGEILGHLLGAPPVIVNLPISGLDAFPASSANGWLNPDRRLRALLRQAEHALAILRRDPDWRRLPFALFHPYHAGDALFVALGASLAEPLLFDGQIVCSAFADVVRAASSPLALIELDLPPMARDGSVSKYRYFVQALDHLGGDFAKRHFVVFGRLLRMHHFTPFHLIDHAKFTLGSPMRRIEETIYCDPVAALHLHDAPATPLRLLFHLNGGWPLKTYPEKATRALFATLKEIGCEITVIDRPDLESAGAHSVAAPDTERLAAQVDAHHLFVGVDSFPLHFAGMIRRRPTVALFGSTRAHNHDAAPQPGYRSMMGPLPCNTCLSKTGCPVMGGNDCVNYPEPAKVASAIVEMAARHYGFVPAA